MDIYEMPLVNTSDAARYLAVAPETLRNWRRTGLVHSLEAERKGWPNLPFVGVVEAFVLERLREMGIPMARIKEAAMGIREKLNDQYGLARPGLGVHGRDILVSVADGLYRGADLQQAATETVQDFQEIITWSGDDPQRLKLTNLGADVILDPRFGWGRPVVESNKVPVEAILGLWRAGESLETVADEFGMTAADVEELARAESRSRWVA